MEYSAGMTARPFWYIETKKTAKMIIDGLTYDEIRKIVIEQNIYQVSSNERALQIFGTIYRRLINVDKFLIEKIVYADVVTSKILVMIALMKYDRLFFEFMYEVFREKLILGDYLLKDRDINVFFDNKISQNSEIAKWSESSIKKLKSTYWRILFEVSLISSRTDERKIVPVSFDYKISQYLKDNGMAVYLYSIVEEH